MVGPVEQAAPERVGVLAGGVRHLVDEALQEEGVLRGADAAPEHHRHVSVLLHRPDLQRRDAVAVGGEHLDGHGLDHRRRQVGAQRT